MRWFAALTIVSIALAGAGDVEMLYRLHEDDRERVDLQEVLRAVRGRLADAGLAEVAVDGVMKDGLHVRIPAAKAAETARVKALVAEPACVELRITVEPEHPSYERYWKRFQDERRKGVPLDEAALVEPDEVAEGDDYRHGLRWYRLSERAARDDGYSKDRLPCDAEGKPAPWVLCELDPYNIGGTALTNVVHRKDLSAGLGAGWVVTFDVRSDCQDKMAALTELDREKHLAIILNGRVHSAPILHSQLSSSGQISGDFTEEQAKDVAAILRSSVLRHPPQLEWENVH